MKIVVIGGTGLIGSKTVAILRQGGHEVVAASPQNGIDSITGEGHKEVMAGAEVVHLGVADHHRAEARKQGHAACLHRAWRLSRRL